MEYHIFVPELESEEVSVSCDIEIPSIQHVPRVGEKILIDCFELIVVGVHHDYNHGYIWIDTEFSESFMDQLGSFDSFDQYKKSCRPYLDETH